MFREKHFENLARGCLLELRLNIRFRGWWADRLEVENKWCLINGEMKAI